MQPNQPNNGPHGSEMPDVSDHELIKCIGKGSFGQVWLARTITYSWRAIKVVWRNSDEDETCFKREYEGLQKYEPISRGCSSLVTVLHAGHNDRFFYYSMELADALTVTQPFDPQNYKPKTLRSLLKQQKRLTIEECLNLGVVLTQALDDLHRHALVHRDIKPSNVIYVNNVPKLADIGLITQLDSTASFVGTEGYVAPEGPGSAQSDIYSLGKLLYEASTGLDRKQYPELPGDMPDVDHKNRFMSLQAIIDKACVQDPKKRYDSAKAMHEDLKRLAEGKSLHRWPTPISSVTFILMILLISASTYWIVTHSNVKQSVKISKVTLGNKSTEHSTNIYRADITNYRMVLSGMVSLPSGTFVMGDISGDGIAYAMPIRTTSLGAFYMDKYEVTKGLWDTVASLAVSQGYHFTGKEAGKAKAINHPVHSTSWFDAIKWCNARSQLEGRTPVYYTDAALRSVYKSSDIVPYVKWDAQGYRLPTEAEWEYAARGGVTGLRFSWGDTITHNQANYSSVVGYWYDISATRAYHPAYIDEIQPYTSPVGSFAPNAYGLYEMAGNMWEWCWDWYGDTHEPGTVNNPHGTDNPHAPEPGSFRVRKGGSWSTYAGNLRSADRHYDHPSNSSELNAGFRTVLPNLIP